MTHERKTVARHPADIYPQAFTPLHLLNIYIYIIYIIMTSVQRNQATNHSLLVYQDRPLWNVYIIQSSLVCSRCRLKATWYIVHALAVSLLIWVLYCTHTPTFLFYFFFYRASCAWVPLFWNLNFTLSVQGLENKVRAAILGGRGWEPHTIGTATTIK